MNQNPHTSSVEINVAVYHSGELTDGITRPVRQLPGSSQCGVVFKKRVYPLRVHGTDTSAESGRWFIEIRDRSFARDDCPVVDGNVTQLLESTLDHSATAISPTSSTTGESKQTVHEVDTTIDVLTRASDEDIESIFVNATSFLRGREATVLIMRYDGGSTLQKIGDHFGVTRERIRQIERKALRRLSARFNRSVSEPVVQAMREKLATHGGVMTREALAKAMGCSKIWIDLIKGRSPAENRASEWSIGSSDAIYYQGRNVSIFKDSEEIISAAAEVVGPSRVMRVDHAMSLLSSKFDWLVNSEGEDVNLAAMGLERIGAWTLIEADAGEAMTHGRWLHVGLTKAAAECCQAIIYGSPHRDGFEDLPISSLPTTDVFVSWLEQRLGVKRNERAFDSLCTRFPDVFVRTSPRSWGVIGAGATQFDPTSYPAPDKPENGAVIRAMTDAITSSDNGLTENEVLGRVRQQFLDVSPSTVRLYLTWFHRERFEEKDDGRFHIRQSYVEHLGNPKQRSKTVQLLTRVMKDAGIPLNSSEIIKLCEAEQYVDHSAILGYLSQGYGGRFHRTTDGKYFVQ